MKRLGLFGVALAFTLLSACVTINVYFPAAAAERAAEQFIGTVIGGETAADKKSEGEKPADQKPPQASLLDFIVSSAHAAEAADLNVQTPALREIQARMKQRFDSTLQSNFASGAIGFTKDGLVAVRDAATVPLSQRAALNQAVSEDNRDRNAVYREIAVANGHAEWEAQIRGTFAAKWVEQARGGWYYQDPSGAWKQK